jgi:hypothetical protein
VILREAIPRATSHAMTTAPSAWAAMRERHPGAILVRFINRDAGRQCFIVIARTPEHAAAEVYDGATIHVPAAGSRDAAARIERAADEAFARGDASVDLLEVAA